MAGVEVVALEGFDPRRPDPERIGERGGDQQQGEAAQPVKQVARRQRRRAAPGAGRPGDQPDVAEGGDQPAQRRTSGAVASAAMPSPRPVKPSRSEVVALTLTLSNSIPAIRAISARIAAAW